MTIVSIITTIKMIIMMCSMNSFQQWFQRVWCALTHIYEWNNLCSTMSQYWDVAWASVRSQRIFCQQSVTSQAHCQHSLTPPAALGCPAWWRVLCQIGKQNMVRLALSLKSGLKMNFYKVSRMLICIALSVYTCHGYCECICKCYAKIPC